MKATRRPPIVIVTGPPGAGKTVLGRRLCRALLLRERKYEALQIGGAVVEVDTTDFEAVDYESLERRVSRLVGRDG